jgi:hypothetical protein
VTIGIIWDRVYASETSMREERTMGVKLVTDYVCDYCEKEMNGGTILVGRIALRRPGAKGIGRVRDLALHPGCLDELTSNAERGGRPQPARERRRRKAASG